MSPSTSFHIIWGETAMTVVLARSFAPAQCSTTYRYLLHRAGRLQITEAELEGLSLAQIKAFVKKRYHELAKHYHPDIVTQVHPKYFPKRKWDTYGFTFQKITKTYQWFMGLNAIVERRKPKFRDTIPDDPLPWYLERKPLSLPCGFNETREYLAYR